MAPQRRQSSQYNDSLEDDTLLSQQCLYEILGVERTATVEEIRFAYRKLALKWHPDKIQQSGASAKECDEATQRFQGISRAYEVLGDSKERAWYDSHRSAILSSSSSSQSAPSAPPEFDFNLWPYFSPSAFSGFGESGKGFYAVYNGVFQKLHEQELVFSKMYGGGLLPDAPSLGGPKTPHTQVTAFYNYWLGFSTVKEFTWCDEYNPAMAVNRKERRLIEEENKKIRKKAKREFNDAVRELVAFVKKRDKRVLERQLEVQRLQKEKEEAAKLRKKQLQQEKLAKALEFEEQEWSKNEDKVDEMYETYWDKSVKARDDSFDVIDHELYCIICGKKFRSEKQWQNHEKSKKHLEKAALLKDSLREEDQLLQAKLDALEQPESSMDIVSSEHEGVNKGDEEEDYFSTNEEENIADENGNGSISEEDDDYVDSVGDHKPSLVDHVQADVRIRSSAFEKRSTNDAEDEETSMLAALLESHSNRRYSVNSVVKEEGSSRTCEEDEQVSSTLFDSSQINETTDNQIDTKRKKSRRKTKLEKNHSAIAGRHSTTEKEMASLGEGIEDMKLESRTAEDGDDTQNGADAQKAHHAKPMKSHAQSAHNTDVSSRAGSNQIHEGKRGGKGRKNKAADKVVLNTCQVCGQDFDSRNQLFKHMSSTSHFVPVGKR